MFLLDKEGIRLVQITASVLVFLLALLLVFYSNINVSSAFSYNYISSLGVSFGFQATSTSVILVLMSAIVFLAASLVFKSFIRENQRTYGILFALVQGSAIALFLSSNLLLFYVFWEIAEFAMFFIILLYGGLGKRHAAIKFIIYSIISSLLLLLGILLIYTSTQTFDIATIIAQSASIPLMVQLAVVVLLMLSFIIKMPVFPLHGWLPDAHTEAPATGSMVLAGVLLKFSGYGLILLTLMIPLALEYSSYLVVLFAFSAIYAAFVATRQSNLKRAIAYTSIVEMGIVAIGIISGTTVGLDGALYAMLAHGIAVSLLFLMAGALGEAYETLEIKNLYGVIKEFRGVAYLFIFGVFAAVGLPLTAGFLGDLLIFIGGYGAFGIPGLVALLAILLMAGFLFWVVEKMIGGEEENEPVERIHREIYLSGLFLACCTVVLGILPFLLIL